MQTLLNKSCVKGTEFVVNLGDSVLPKQVKLRCEVSSYEMCSNS